MLKWRCSFPKFKYNVFCLQSPSALKGVFDPKMLRGSLALGTASVGPILAKYSFSTFRESRSVYDVAIVGAGMVGLALAASLRKCWIVGSLIRA